MKIQIKSNKKVIATLISIGATDCYLKQLGYDRNERKNVINQIESCEDDFILIEVD